MNHIKFFKCTLAIIFIIALALISQIVSCEKKHSSSPILMTSLSAREAREELVIRLLSKSTQEAVTSFYEDFLSEPPMVYTYEQEILSVIKQDPLIQITLGVTPIIGTHDPIGYDKITFGIAPDGGIQLLEFSHIKTYEDTIKWHEQRFKNLPLPITCLTYK